TPVRRPAPLGLRHRRARILDHHRLGPIGNDHHASQRLHRMERPMTQASNRNTGADQAGKRLPVQFDAYEIHGMKRLSECYGMEEDPTGFVINDWEQVGDADAEFWSLFGHIPGQGLDCIGDSATREHAEEIYARIAGRRYEESNRLRPPETHAPES